MSEIEDAFQRLIKATALKDETSIIDNLGGLSKEMELTDVVLIQDLLKFHNIHILKTATELIAELAKIEHNRKICTNEEIIKDLLNLLENADPDIVLHSIRALGNICYENEAACNIIEKIGANKLLSILKDDSKRQDTMLTIKTSGLLLNLFNMNDVLMRAALKDGAIPLLESLLYKYAKNFDQNEQLLTFLVSIVNNLEHLLDEQNIPFTTDLCKILINIFKQSKIPEISVPCLEIFHAQCEQEDIKILLAKEGVCELLFDHIEKYRHQIKDEDSRSVLKMACDFIVVILTGDDCMQTLYNDGRGVVYKNMVTWLDSDDPDLLSTGILALGNFARKDAHCIEMVDHGISKKLLDILKKYNANKELEDVKIQHALLSTLKNLVIPQKNKSIILREGLIGVIYPMIKIDQDLVVFKLLGTFRMVIDGQESTALDLISRREFIEKLVYWCYNSDHLGVRGEVPRLLAWLIKQCNSCKPFLMLLDIPDCIKCVTEMLSSNHAVMQNEALNAINLLYVGCPQALVLANPDAGYEESEAVLNKLMKVLVDADVGKNFNFLLNKYGDKMNRPTLESLINILDLLCNSSEIVKHFKDTDVLTPLNKLYNNHNVCRITTLHRIETLLSE